MKREDYDALDRARQDDAEHFARFPDREYRLRRAWPVEVTGDRPAGYEVFTILHRYDVGRESAHAHFGTKITFETARDDAAIRKILAALAQNPRAMLNA